ncbi:MerR family transcriptional regulator [Dictyobacter sp. S3.2.2.5]|uniref:MerR family transcriptional regulator n=1 Tax=Dictyobacter halimunensis TaxID=3026934 RepID=A0ABQ6G6G0_9CHLR|nr:MerR family transcriptional regulator [Dictyobacter sp. S3.2.2.5]
MMVHNYLRTTDLAQAGQISVQQVRNYEASGFIPPVERSPSGYRLYTKKHLVALQTARGMVSGYTWQQARAIMQAVHQDKLTLALALVDEYHADLAYKRLQLDQTLAALGTLAAQSPSLASMRHPQQLRVGEAAKQVGVRVSALHFWEQQGLLHPIRDKSSKYRLYDEQQMRRLRVVVLLRDAGYDFTAIHTALNELTAGRTERAIAAVEKRRAELAKISWARLGAISAFHNYISEFYAEQIPRSTP